MKALLYTKSIPKWALLRYLGPRFPSLYTGCFSVVSLADVDPAPLPNQRWVRIAPDLTGICGSDIATFTAKGSPYLGPITSMPFVLGHELVGRVSEVGSEVDSVSVGDRVVLQPALGCTVRGIDPPCQACAEGKSALCSNVTRGDIGAGIQTGYCKDTGGGFSQNLVAHHSQVYRIPESMSDKAAVLIEPFSCALHGVLRTEVKDSDTVFIVGCGTIGLLTIAALRATGSKAKIVASALLPHQQQHATRLGADELVTAGGKVDRRYPLWAKALGAEVLKPELGKPTVIGGADVTFDCVAISQTIDDSIRFTRSGGTLVLVGMPGVPKDVDWTPLWFKELTLKATYAYGFEQTPKHNRETFDIAIELMQTWADKLEPLVSDPYAMEDYRAAFSAALRTDLSQSIKTAIAIDQPR